MRASARSVALLVVVATVLGMAIMPAGATDDDAGAAGAPEAPGAPEAGRQSRIVGGVAAANGAWPSQVALIDRSAPNTYQGQFCGGTVIDRSWILTAAHCVYDPPDWRPSAGQIDVLVGTNHLNGGGTRIRAVELRVHPGWDRSRLRNDVALIRLDHPVPGGIPNQILGTSEDFAPYALATAVGWGAQNDPPTSFPTALRQVDLELGSDSDCAPYPGPIYHSPTQLCGFWPGKGVCFGDSGGPLLISRGDGTYAQIGISSYVHRPCGTYPGYFTEVAAFSTWIKWQVRYGPQPNANAFVKRQYLDLFGRQPTSTELFYGVAGLEDGQSTAAYVASLLENATYKARSGGVIRLYKAIFLRAPDTAGLAFWMGEINRGVSLKRIADLMVRAQEFTTMYGTKTDAEFVDLVYDNVLGRPASDTDRDFWTEELTSGRRTRGQVMVGFSESAEYRIATDPVTRVTAAFWALVRRVPTTAEISQWQPKSTGDIARFLLTSWTYANRF